MRCFQAIPVKGMIKGTHPLRPPKDAYAWYSVPRELTNAGAVHQPHTILSLISTVRRKRAFDQSETDNQSLHQRNPFSLRFLFPPPQRSGLPIVLPGQVLSFSLSLVSISSQYSQLLFQIDCPSHLTTSNI